MWVRELRTEVSEEEMQISRSDEDEDKDKFVHITSQRYQDSFFLHFIRQTSEV